MMQDLHGFGAPANAARILPSTNINSASQYARELDVLAREIKSNPSFLDSVALQTRWRDGLSGTNGLERQMDERSRLMNLRKNAWQEIENFIRYYQQHFQATVAREHDNYDFYYGYQWDDAEIKRLQQINAIPHVSNYMTRWARTLVGEKRGTQTKFNFESEDDAYKPVTELYNQVCNKLARANEWEYKSGDAFANLGIAGRCFMSVQADPYQPFNKVLMRNERFEEFMYDFDNAENGVLDGCTTLMRAYYRDLEEVIFLYPEWEDYLINYDYQASAGIEHLLSFTVTQPKVPPTAFKRVQEVPARFIKRPYFQRRRVAWITEFMRMEGVKQWIVRDGNYNIEYDFDAADTAAYFYRNLRDASIARNIATTGKPGVDLVMEPQRGVRKQMTRELWCSNVLLDVQTSRAGRFPYVGQHNEFHDGQWRGYFEDDKPNQKMRNRMHVILDMALGNVKDKSFYHESLFSTGSTEQQRQEMIRDPLKAFIGNWPKDSDPKNLHFTVQSSHVDGTTIRTMTEFIEKASNFVNGGLNSVGDAEFAGQSDRLRRGLQQSAQTGTVGLFSDWGRAEDRVGQHLVYTTQGLHPTVLLELANTEDRERFLPLLQTMSHSVEMDKITMKTEEILSGPSDSDRQAAALLEVAGQDPEMLQDVMPEVMRLKRFPQAMVDRINERQGARHQAQAQQAQHEQDMADREMIEKMTINERKVEIEAGHLEVKKNPPVQVAIAMKANAPGPDAMAEVWKQHNIDADPQHILASEAKQDMKDQTRDDIRQKSFNVIDLPYQKSLAALHPTEKKPAKKTGDGVRSAKDRNNRSRKKAERSKTQV